MEGSLTIMAVPPDFASAICVAVLSRTGVKNGLFGLPRPAPRDVTQDA